MSLTPEQQTLKEQGNAALSAGDAARALELFSKAIDINGGSAEGRAILYSNRAAACTQSRDYQSALEDAEECTKLDPSFAKGWSRKAAALHGLGKYKEAADFYRTAATKAMTPELCEEYKRMAEKCEADSRPQTSASSQTPSASSTGASSSYAARSREVMSPLVITLRVFSFLVGFGWFVTGDAQYYRLGMLLIAAASVITIIEAIGRPRMTVEYAERFLQHSAKPFFLLPIVYSSMPPVPPAFFNVQLVGIGSLARNLQGYLRRAAPGIADKVSQRVNDSALLAKAAGIPGWQTMSADERFARFDTSMEQICSRFELAVMALLIVHFLAAPGNFVSLLVYFQVLKLRYLIYEPTRTSIHNLDMWLTDVGRRYPVASKIYAPIRSGVVWLGSQGVRNAASRPRNAGCNIM